MKRGVYWAGVVLGVLLLAGGSVLAVIGYAETAGPSGVVRSYFASLAQGDAPTALAFGDVPDGPRELLTSEVLQAQQRIAPLHDLRVGSVRRNGHRALVAVRYVLAFAGRAQKVNARVGVHQVGGDWRLDAVAVRASLDVGEALDRASIAGAGIPPSETLLFPGAVPITFDSPYLQLDPTTAHVDFGGDPVLRVDVQVSARGRAATLAAVDHALRSCLAGSGDLTCPLPSERYVPGSIQGRVDGSLAKALTINLRESAIGVIDVRGKVPIRATHYQQLTFSNRALDRSGHLVLDLHARLYAIVPLHLVWLAS